MTSSPSPEEQLRAENADLRGRLEEAEETLRAIRSGEVDALIVETADGPQIFSLDAAQAASNRFRGEILAQVSDAVIAADADQRVTYLNAAAERQYRISASEALGRHLSDILTRHWPLTETQAAMWAALREQGEWRGEIIHRTHEGREIAVESSVTALRDASGVLAGYVSVIRDITERKQTEADLSKRNEQLAEADARIRSVVNNVIYGIITIDERGVVETFNSAAEQLFGYKAEEVVGQNVGMLMGEPHKREHDGYLADYKRTGQDKIIGIGREVEGRRSDGSTFLMDLGISEFLRGGRRCFTGVVRDITERMQAEARMIKMNEQLMIASVRQHELTETAETLSVQLQTDLTARMVAEESLRESQHFIHSVLYNLFAFVGVMTVDGTLTDANRSSLEGAGIPASEVLGKKFWDCYWWNYSPESQAQLRDACMRAAGGEVVRYDVPVRMAGDTRVWIDFQVSPLRDTKGRITHLIPSALEIEVRHAAEQALRESEERFRIMADGLPLMIWVHDAQGQLQFVNQAYCEFFGVTPQQVAGPNWHPLVHSQDLAAYASEFSACVRDRRPFHAEVRVRRFDGEWRWIESRAHPRFSASGEFLGMVGSSPDITERRKTDEALRASEAQERISRAQAEAANRAKDVFLATLSHELRTPLNAVLGWAVMLRTMRPADGSPVHPDVDHGLAVIERNARAQGKLIEDVLDVARITSGKFMLDTRPLDLTGVVLAAADAVRLSAAGKSIALEVFGDTVPGGVWVNADSSRIQQAVLNLLINAVKFTPNGGRVTVSLERAKHDGADIARITVIDTGKGIDAAFLPSAFDRFKQGGEGTTRSYGGLGLGLSVVKHIMEAHGGTVRGQSEGEGKGATFTLELPAMPEAELPRKSAIAATSMSPQRLDGVRVLVVDDDDDARNMTGQALEAVGAVVVLAASAAEGYRLGVGGNGATGPQVIVSDIGMPFEDGYSMMRRVRTTKSGIDLPALAVTAFASPEDKNRAQLAGFQAHLSKPIDPHDLIAAVGILTGR